MWSFTRFLPRDTLIAWVFLTPQGFCILINQLVWSSQRASSTFAILEVRLVIIHFHVIELLWSSWTQAWRKLVWQLIVITQRVISCFSVTWTLLVVEACFLATHQFLTLSSKTSMGIGGSFSTDLLETTIHYASLSSYCRPVFNRFVEVLYATLSLLIVAFPLLDVRE